MMKKSLLQENCITIISYHIISFHPLIVSLSYFTMIQREKEGGENRFYSLVKEGNYLIHETEYNLIKESNVETVF